MNYSQQDWVISRLRQFGKITVTEAWEIGHIRRLSAIIFEMRHNDKDWAWDIETIETEHPKETTYKFISRKTKH